MAIAGGASIEAVLTLNASGFETTLSNVTNLVKNFVTQVNSSSGNVNGFNTAIDGLVKTLNDANLNFAKFQEQAKGIESFNKFANGVKALATAIDTLGKESEQTSTGLTRVTEIIKSLEGTFGVAEVKITGVANALRNMTNSTAQSLSREQQLFNDMRNGLNALASSITRTGNVITDQEARAILKLQETTRQLQVMEGEFNKAESELMQFANTGVEAFNRIGRSVDSYVAKTNMLKLSNPYNNIFDSNDKVVKATEAVERNSIAMQRNGVEKLRNMGYTGQLDSTEQRLKAHTDQSTSSIQRQASASNTATASTNRFATATSRLGKTLSSLKMMGTMVGSMLAYNFAHHLAQATNETIQSKSEMEGYFKMLNYGQDDINRFNQALDQTVTRFQRVNKYSLGETISSIGVEFNLTTEEMIKAMDVTSMITSEYLRAGRNANEASLAVKDVLQGQFQRLSRETGVKGEQLKEAGWNGDVNDVNSLLDALRKVAEDRNWDVFAEKANSLNDIVTILQNRFGEWSADMINVVQPSIVNAFNAIMSVGQAIAGVLGGVWQWLNTDGWGQTAVKIGLVGTALLTTSQMLLMYRANVGLVEASQMGLTKSIASVILGLKGQEVAEVGVKNSIMAKILGIKAETIAEQGVTGAIAQKITSLQASTVQQEANSVATGMNTTAQQLSTTTTQGLTVAKEMETAQEEVNTAMKELNTAETLKQEGANTGLIASLYMLGTAELYDAEATGTLATAWGVLNGVFSLSPIGWLTLALAGLATAIYTLTGGFDSLWGSLQNANSAIEDASSATKPYRDYVEQTNQELEEAKEKYGENSLVVQALSEKYDRAKDSLDAYYEKLQQATSQHSKLNDELEVTSAKMDEIMRAELGDVGYGEKEIEEMTTGISDLSRLQDHDYVALQKHTAMMGNFSDAVHNFAENADGDTEAIQNFGKTYYDFINYSDKANTADNWWDWATNSFMAGVSGKSLDIQKVLKGVWDTDKDPNAYRDFTKTIFDGLGNAWNETSKEWGNTLNNIDWGAFGDIGGNFSKWIDDAKKSIDGSWKGLTETFKPITDFFNDPLKMFGMDAVSASDGSSDHPSFMEDVSSILGFDVQAWVDSFMADPLGTLGIDLGGFDIFGTLINYLFGIGDALDFSWATEWLNNNIITPISETWNNFMADPLSFIGGAVLGAGGIGGLLTLLLPSDGGVGIWEWVNNTIIQPMSQALWSGITSIPLVSDILALFGLVNGENSGSSQKGTDLGNSFKTAIENVIRNIPILGDILQILGLIPNANPTASSNGQGVGSSVKQGLQNGINGIASIINTEMSNVVNTISNWAGQAYAVAHDIGSQILNGIKNALDMHSPSIISRELINNEFGVYIPEAITSNGELAYQSAQYYGQQITAGISSVNTDSLGLDTAVGNYETDAQMIAMSSQMMGMETTTAFNDMSLAVNNTTATMSSNVGTTYSQMQQKQSSSLQSMKTQNQTAYNEMYLKSNQSLVQMRDSTTNITHQMINAWSHMKTQLVATANQLRSESTSHFNRLSETIGSFYRKIQNPSNWGAGTGSSTPVRSRRNTTAGRSFARGMRTRTSLHGAGTSSTYTGSKYMTIGSLKRKLCPDGSCDYLFNGMDSSERVNVEDFLATITGEHGFGGWSGWNTTHFNHIKNTSDQWDMASPVIQVVGGVPTNAQFKVGDFENGTPSISFDSFKSMAESIFTAIPYRHYMDSSWKGSWLGAIQSGACNCSDGAEAIIAFASACGFGGGQKVHGYWGNEGHFWAVINGEVFDTTAMQKGYGWRSPSVHGYGTKVRTTVSSGDAPSNGNKTVNVTIDMSNSTIYGVDDLDSRIKTGVEEGLKEQFNDPYTVELI